MDESEWRAKRKMESLVKQLEVYYPEHMVFALDSIDGKLREELTRVRHMLNYESNDALLLAYGFKPISKEEIKNIRPEPFLPGTEPECIKGKVDSMISRLEEYYPDHIIPGKLQSDHKKLSQHISGLYQWLGYSDSQAMLKAYGFEYRNSMVGRPANNVDVIAELKDRYPNGATFTTIKDLVEENPDLAGSIKTCQNTSRQQYGMPFLMVLKKEGIFSPYKKSSRLVVQDGSTEEMRDQLDSLVMELRQRYADAPLETSIGWLEFKNKDLPVSRASSWVKKVYGRTLAEFLREQGLLGGSASNEPKKTERQLKNAENARGKLKSLTDELSRRYPVGATLETTIWNLNQKNADLPIQTAESWARTGYGLSLPVYLRQINLLGDNDIVVRANCSGKDEEVVPPRGTEDALILDKIELGTNYIDDGEIFEEDSIENRNVEIVVEETEQESNVTGWEVVESYSVETIDSIICVLADKYYEYIEKNEFEYGLEHYLEFIRNEYNYNLRYFLHNSGEDFDEKLVGEIIKKKSNDFWISRFWKVLENCMSQLDSDMVVDYENGFVRKNHECILALPYYINDKIGNISLIGEHRNDLLCIKGNYFQEAFQYDTEIVAGNAIIGRLSANRWKQETIGNILAILLWKRLVVVNSVRFSINGERIIIKISL